MSIAIVITTTILGVEAVGGFMTNSLALLSDAGHMLTDLSALTLSFLAITWSGKAPTPAKTFGYYRLEILSALFNGVLLVLMSAYIFHEAIQRFLVPREVRTLEMLAYASVGLAANLVALTVLRRSSSSLNVRGALLHVAGDALSSVGVIAAGVIMLFTGWFVVDSMISMGIALAIIVTSTRLVRDAVNVILEATPRQIDLSLVEKTIKEINGVADVHDTHVWCLTPDICCLSAHVIVYAHHLVIAEAILNEIKKRLAAEFNIYHTTLQMETRDYQEVGHVHENVH